MNFYDTLFEIFGYLGGFILGICLMPQIIQSINTKSTKDISLCWQLLYGIGVSFLLAYAIYNNLLAVYIPGFLELLCIIVLVILKIKYDIIGNNNKYPDNIKIHNSGLKKYNISV